MLDICHGWLSLSGSGWQKYDGLGTNGSEWSFLSSQNTIR